MTLTFKIILGVAIATILGLICMQFIDLSTTNNVVDNVTETTRLSIGISGFVVSPGKFLLDEGATMQDLIDKAGGVNDRADTRCYFPTATVNANEDYYIPPRYDPSDICGTEEIQKVNINTYTDPEALTYIDDIGLAISKSILNFREEHGEFKTLESIKQVNGIGQATYTRLRNYIMLKD